MFNKRETSESETQTRSGFDNQTPAAKQATPAAPARSPAGAAGSATIGPSISIDGTLKGEEDLTVEGRIKGTVQLKAHTLTVGAQGTLDAEVYAHTILVEGTVNGDLYASECISIRKSARVKGNILAPRISLEDGAKFRGSIDMDSDSENFRKAFGSKTSAPASSPGNAKPSPEQSAFKGESNKGESDKGKQRSGPQQSSSGNASDTGSAQAGKSGSSAA